MDLAKQIEIKNIGQIDYLICLANMKAYTAKRTKTSPDQIWILEHPSVYTLGLAVQDINVEQLDAIPIVKSDRGGKITFHGPGQLVVYLLIDLKRRGLFLKQFVFLIEQAVIDCLMEFGIFADRRLDAPGVYILSQDVCSKLTKPYVCAKIASIGLKIINGCSYHGVSLNVNMDLSPFFAIYPCGLMDVKMVDMRTLGLCVSKEQVGNVLQKKLQSVLSSV